MRKQLKKLYGQTHRFVAIVDKYSKTRDQRCTILFKNIKLFNQEIELTDHNWSICTKIITNANLSPGEIIEFDATIVSYLRPQKEIVESKTKRRDYKLAKIRKITKL